MPTDNNNGTHSSETDDFLFNDVSKIIKKNASELVCKRQTYRNNIALGFYFEHCGEITQDPIFLLISKKNHVCLKFQFPDTLDYLFDSYQLIFGHYNLQNNQLKISRLSHQRTEALEVLVHKILLDTRNNLFNNLEIS